MNFSIKTFVIEIDKNGNERWNETYDDWYGVNILSLTDGYLIAGYTEESKKIVVLKVDKDGNIVWKKFYSIAGGSIVMDAVKARDGFIVGGFTGMPCNVFLLKIDKEGNEIWNRTYGGRGDETLERIINCGDVNHLFYSFYRMKSFL